MCKDFRDDRFPEPHEEIDYSSHGGFIQARVANLPPDILGADIVELEDTRALPRVGDETFRKILAIMGLENPESQNPTPEVA